MQLVATTGQVYPLKVGVNTIGRAAGNDIVLNDGSMSRRHAELRWDGYPSQHCMLTDLGSTNGTFLGSQRMTAYQPQPVSPGVPLSFGPTMVVTLAADTGGIATAHVAMGPVSFAPAASLDLLFRALDVALDRRKLALTTLGFLVVGIVGALFFWILAQVGLDSAIVGAAIGLVGAILLWCILTFVTATLTRLIFQELSEGTRGNVRQALQYASQHFLTFLLSPLVLVIGLVLVLAVESIFLLVGRVEYVGELVVSLAFLPLVALNLGVILVAVFGTALTYPIVADRGGGIRDTISCVLALVRRAPGRLVAYMVLTGLTSLLMFIPVFYLISAALYTTSALTRLGMDPNKFSVVVSGLPLDIGNLIPALAFGSFGRSWLGEPPVTYSIARYLLGLSLLGLVMVVLALPQMFYLTSMCAVYLNLRRDLPNPMGEGNRASRIPLGASGSQAGDQKQCWLCGKPLAHDQTYCPHCKQMQRSVSE